MPRKVVPQLHTISAQGVMPMQYMPAPAPSAPQWSQQPQWAAPPMWSVPTPMYQPQGQWVPVPQAVQEAEAPEVPKKPRKPNAGAKIYRDMTSEAAALGVSIADPARPGKWLKTAALREKIEANKREIAAQVEASRQMELKPEVNSDDKK